MTDGFTMTSSGWNDASQLAKEKPSILLHKLSFPSTRKAITKYNSGVKDLVILMNSRLVMSYNLTQ